MACFYLKSEQDNFDKIPELQVCIAETLYDIESVLADPTEDTTVLQRLLKPYPHDKMEMYPVSTRVNSAKNDDEACVQAIADMEPA